MDDSDADSNQQLTNSGAAADSSSQPQPPSSIFNSYQYYIKVIRQRVLGLLPSALVTDLNLPEKITFIEKITNLYKPKIVPSSSRRSRHTCLPLPFPSQSLESFELTPEASRVYEVLGDIVEHVFFNLHSVEKNLQFWQTRAEGSTSQKVYFMVFERGPLAFLDGSGKLLHDYVFYGTGVQNVSSLASAHISERISVLTSLRKSLATFLAQVYEEVDQIAEQIVQEPEKSLAPLLGTINGLFLKLEATIGHVSATRQVGSSVDGSYSSPLLFEKLPDINQEGSQWTDCAIRDAINMVYLNLDKLNVYLSLLVAKHQKPRKMTQHWILYTVVAVGVSLFSLWLLRHSRLAASSDIDNWIIEAKDSLKGFLNDHVEQPDTRAEGKGRIARVQRRHLIVEIEKRISQLQNFIDQGQEKDAQCMHGLILYTLDRLYRAVERPAKATGEWRSLRQDICDLGKPNLQTSNMLIVTSRIKQMYECLRPSVSR